MWREGAVCTTKYTLHSKHPLKQSVSFSSRRYSIYSFAQPAVLAQHWGKELWMLALGFLLFSCPFPFYTFPFKNMQLWTLDGKISFSYFSTSMFPLKKFLVNSSKNELWMGRCGRRGSVHHKYTLHSKHPLKQSVSFSSRRYSIYSFCAASCPSTALGKELWILALGFLLFLFPFPFYSFLFKNLQMWTLNVKISSSYFSTSMFPLESSL